LRCPFKEAAGVVARALNPGMRFNLDCLEEACPLYDSILDTCRLGTPHIIGCKEGPLDGLVEW